MPGTHHSAFPQSWTLYFLQTLPASSRQDFTIDELRAGVSQRSEARCSYASTGQYRPATPGEKLAEVRTSNDLRASSGDPIKEAALHQALCRLPSTFGRNQAQPRLTTANRHTANTCREHRRSNAIIHKEYLSYNIDARRPTLEGMVVEQSPEDCHQRSEEPRGDRPQQIDMIRESPMSLMPENIIKN
jgi:hypothetical protein